MSDDDLPGLPPHAFTKEDPTPDRLFYAAPRFVTHIDDRAIAAVTALYREVLPPGGTILDLMGSWVAHLPPDIAYGEVIGHGLNADELAANPRYDRRFVQDLNEDCTLPLATGSVDAVAICVSVQYLQHPVTVFREIARVLRPGGAVAVTFSNRCFPTKAVAIWQALPAASTSASSRSISTAPVSPPWTAARWSRRMRTPTRSGPSSAARTAETAPEFVLRPAPPACDDGATFADPSEAMMTHYLLVSFKTCPWVQRAAIVLREKKTPFEFRHIEPDNRPDWFLAMSPHKKVPVLRIDDKVSLFESNAIAEYLDETIAPRLHPEDPIARAVNRAWTDYVPTFADVVTATGYADTEAEYNKAAAKIPVPFERLERALEKQGAGPFFNGARYSLVDAAYAPFLQRYFFLDRVKKLGHIEKFPRLKAWGEALVQRAIDPLVPARRIRAMYRDNLKRRKKWVSQFIDGAKVAAE